MSDIIIDTITKELLDDCLQNQKFINLKTSTLTSKPPQEWIKVRGCNNRNKNLVKQMYDLYINGDMHPTVYCKIFGLNPSTIRGALKLAGPMMDRKTSLEVYGAQTLALREETMMDLYQVKNAGQSPIFQEKAQQTNLIKFKVRFASQAEEVKEKQRETVRNKPKKDTAESDAKRRATNIFNHGVEHYFQSEEFKQKRKKALENKPIGKRTPEAEAARVAKWKENQDKHTEKSQLTCWERYDAPTFFGSEEGKRRVRESCSANIGVSTPFLSPECMREARRTKALTKGVGDPINDDCVDDIIISNPEERHFLRNGKINNFIEVRKIVLGYKPKEYITELDLSDGKFYRYSKALGMISKTTHTTEFKMKAILNSLSCSKVRYFTNLNKYLDCNEYDYVTNARKLCGVQLGAKWMEQDFFFPKLKLGIEVNGLEYHSVNINTYNNPKSKDYHFEKFKAFRDRGILMLSFTSHEIDNFKDDVINIIKHHILKEPLNVSKEFLEFNQISSIEESLNYGLFDHSWFTGNFEDHQHQRFIDKYEYWDCGVIK
nr:MAG TPA: endonuclease-like protein [Caudoviricetes sp.]